MFLGLPRNPENNDEPTIPENLRERFDVVFGTGVFFEGHIPCNAWHDAYDMLKTGGYFVTSIRKFMWENGEKEGYKDMMDKLINEGKFEMVKNWTHVRGESDESGGELYARMEHFMFVVKKI